MMQEIESTVSPYRRWPGAASVRDFPALFALAGSKSMDTIAFRARMGLTDREFASLVEDLQRKYLVDLVSHLEGNVVRVSLRLTDKGEAALIRLLEEMCELPEWDSADARR